MKNMASISKKKFKVEDAKHFRKSIWKAQDTKNSSNGTGSLMTDFKTFENFSVKDKGFLKNLKKFG